MILVSREDLAYPRWLASHWGSSPFSVYQDYNVLYPFWIWDYSQQIFPADDQKYNILCFKWIIILSCILPYNMQRSIKFNIMKWMDNKLSFYFKVTIENTKIKTWLTINHENNIMRLYIYHKLSIDFNYLIIMTCFGIRP